MLQCHSAKNMTEVFSILVKSQKGVSGLLQYHTTRAEGRCPPVPANSALLFLLPAAWDIASRTHGPDAHRSRGPIDTSGCGV